MITYKDAKIYTINYNKINKAFQVLLEYEGYMICIDVKWKENDTQEQFIERAYAGAQFYTEIMEYFTDEDIKIVNLIVYPEVKDIYNFAITIGNNSNRKIGYIMATSSDSKDRILTKALAIKNSMMKESIEEKRKKFIFNIKQYIGG
ncbi:MAG: hypothetical protein QXV73_04520 [Candidatus Micrarchaeia archaeon]